MIKMSNGIEVRCTMNLVYQHTLNEIYEMRIMYESHIIYNLPIPPPNCIPI